MTILIRAATHDDLPTLREFEQGIISYERPFDPTLRPDPISYYDLGELIDSPDAEVIVAVQTGELIGSGYAKKKASRPYAQPDFMAYIGFLFTHPDHRGKGVNKLILDALLAWARENGLLEVQLTVYPENDSALRAYGKAGFKPHLLDMRLDLKEK